MEKVTAVAERNTYVFKEELWMHPMNGLTSAQLFRSKKDPDMNVI